VITLHYIIYYIPATIKLKFHLSETSTWKWSNQAW